jgi:tryptophan synthase alpha chain
LTVDLTPEEAGKYLDVHRSAGLGTVFLASPTTTRERLSLIDQASSEFIYYVSRLGVTGERSDVSTSLASELKLVRSVASKPIAVGFGISTPEQARDVARLADHVVVGSRLISLIEQSESLEAGVLQLRSFAKISFSMMTA